MLKGAKQYHKLDIDYQGIRNEVKYDTDWIKLLRRTLDDNGLAHVEISAADQWHGEDQWRIADDMVKDPALSNAVAVLNAHIPEMLNFFTPTLWAQGRSAAGVGDGSAAPARGRPGSGQVQAWA